MALVARDLTLPLFVISMFGLFDRLVGEPFIRPFRLQLGIFQLAPMKPERDSVRPVPRSADVPILRQRVQLRRVRATDPKHDLGQSVLPFRSLSTVVRTSS